MNTKLIKEYWQHPVTKRNPFYYLLRYFTWAIKRRVLKDPMIYTFLSKTQFYIDKNHSSAEINYLFDVYDIEETTFLLKLLKPNDLFVDVGANVGIYSLIVAKENKASVIAFEPDPNTAKVFYNNVKLNKMEDKISIIEKIVAENNEPKKFTINQDAINKVIINESENFIAFEAVTLDEVLINKNPAVIKIDVEGYEYHVLQGAKKTLETNKNIVLILEVNGLSEGYDLSTDNLMKYLSELGFEAFDYNMETHKLEPKKYPSHKKNTIFVRDGVSINKLL